MEIRLFGTQPLRLCGPPVVRRLKLCRSYDERESAVRAASCSRTCGPRTSVDDVVRVAPAEAMTMRSDRRQAALNRWRAHEWYRPRTEAVGLVRACARVSRMRLWRRGARVCRLAHGGCRTHRRVRRDRRVHRPGAGCAGPAGGRDPTSRRRAAAPVAASVRRGRSVDRSPAGRSRPPVCVRWAQTRPAQ